jgi:bacterioferritin (cytochrome b1)
MEAADAVIEALNAVYPLILTIKEQTHRQEHAFKAAHYKKLRKKYNRLTNVVHEYWLHRLVCWFASHGAMPDSRMRVVEVAGGDSPADAFAFTDDLLKDLNKALLTACVAVHDADDYVTGKLVHCLLEYVEKWRDCFEAELNVIADVGVKLYLQRMK